MSKDYSNLNEVEQMNMVAKLQNTSKEVVETIIKNECTLLEGKELLDGAVYAFEELIQKHPNKVNEPLRFDLFKSE
ncbi:MAG TPA: hypothetical protein VK067_07540 [Pseudogracilibacillus sp.]|nr:hypothetical protein [Pseudogracilibacillus sp.]